MNERLGPDAIIPPFYLAKANNDNIASLAETARTNPNFLQSQAYLLQHAAQASLGLDFEWHHHLRTPQSRFLNEIFFMIKPLEIHEVRLATLSVSSKDPFLLGEMGDFLST